MSAITKFTRSPRVRTAGAALAVGGMLTYAGVAGAAADQTIRAEGAGTSSHFTPSEVSVTTGETVTWEFITDSHNLMSTNASPTDPRWEPLLYPGPGEYTAAPVGATTAYTFYKSGEYEFVCQIHGAGMSGKVTVTGEDMEIPVPTATPTPTPTVTPTATPTPTPSPSGTTPPPVDDHTRTPPPTPAADAVKPTLSGVKLKAAKRAAKVTFKLSENATVTVKVRKRGAKKVLRTVTLQARAGTRTVVVRSAKLRKGRYTVTLTARDAMGNMSTAASAPLRIRK
jgi:plastocyanin